MAFNVLTVVRSDAAGYVKANKSTAMVENVPAGCNAAMLENRICHHDRCLLLLGHPGRDFDMFAEDGSRLNGETPVPLPPDGEAGAAGGAGGGSSRDYTIVYLELLGPRE